MSEGDTNVMKRAARGFLRRNLPCVVGAGAMILTGGVSTTARAQISLGAGFSYLQNFDSMGASGTTTPTGWTVSLTSSSAGTVDNPNPAPTTMGTGVATGTRVTASTGAGASNNNFNFGSSGSSERALGSVASGNNERDTYVSFTNNTGGALRSFTVNYDGEQWKTGDTANVAGTLTMQISTDGLSWINMGAAYNFTAPNLSTTNAAIDGNAIGNRTANIGGTYTLSTGINNGSNFYLRWVDVDDLGVDAALAIDNFSIVAVPEPSTAFSVLLFVAVLGWNQRRRACGIAGLPRSARGA